MTALPHPQDVTAAAELIAGRVHRTPVLRVRALDEVAGRPLLLKAEHLQRTGAYKARGALHQALRLRASASPPAGVIAASSGNHGQAVAWAAREVGFAATIVVPSTIVAAKRRAIEGYGARIEVVGPSSQERLEVAARIARERGLAEIAPYDHPWTMAGQGTWLAEALADAPLAPEAIVVPVGGGGLAAGTVLGARAAGFGGAVVGVEPAGADDTRRSLRAGRRVRIEAPETIADALRAVEPGELTFEVNRDGLAEIVTVDDAEIAAAMRLLLERGKQLVEPAGAVALAALLAHRVPGSGPALAILSGGNVAAEDVSALVAARSSAARRPARSSHPACRRAGR